MSLAVCDALLRSKPDYSNLGDTLAAITGAVAEAYYGVPDTIRTRATAFLDKRLHKILLEFEKKYPARLETIQGFRD